MAISKKDVAGSVILFNSLLNQIEHIVDYAYQVSKLYIIDNSDFYNNEIQNKLEVVSNIQYIYNGGNKGVANALNQAAVLALKDNFKYLLTMDDDSQPPTGMVETMLSFINRNKSQEIGIISVAHSKPLPNKSFKLVSFTMTSGSLLNLQAYRMSGPFDDNLFIDHVDHEYSLRLKQRGFLTIELSELRLIHNLGEKKRFHVIKCDIEYISHTPNRLYYTVRNGIYIIRKYISVFPFQSINLMYLISKEMFKSLFFEDEKFLRLKYLKKAIYDGMTNRMGKLKV